MQSLHGIDSSESSLAPLSQISDIQDSLDLDPQEHSFTRTIDEEAELEERDDREREEGHPEQDDEDEDREHEVMTAGSKFKCWHQTCISCPSPGCAIFVHHIFFHLLRKQKAAVTVII